MFDHSEELQKKSSGEIIFGNISLYFLFFISFSFYFYFYFSILMFLRIFSKISFSTYGFSWFSDYFYHLFSFLLFFILTYFVRPENYSTWIKLLLAVFRGNELFLLSSFEIFINLLRIFEDSKNVCLYLDGIWSISDISHSRWHVDNSLCAAIARVSLNLYVFYIFVLIVWGEYIR